MMFLGTHKPTWLKRTNVPLFLSRRRLAEVARPARALGPWALDSGGFTELSLYGEWRTSETAYLEQVRRWREEIGLLQWAAIQDWMCEPFMLEKTGLTIEEHQRRTIRSALSLTARAPEIPWVPILQGWRREDYLRHLDAYAAEGLDLTRAPLVGIGSVCRRQATSEAEEIVSELATLGIRLHGFGFKATGARKLMGKMVSFDSMAWSLWARREAPLPGCPHASCANCMRYALQWRERQLAQLRG